MQSILLNEDKSTVKKPGISLDLPMGDLFPYGTFEGILWKVGDQRSFLQWDRLIDKNRVDTNMPLDIPIIDFSESVPLPEIDTDSLPVWTWVTPSSEDK